MYKISPTDVDINVKFYRWVWMCHVDTSFYTQTNERGRHLSTKRVYSQFGWSLFTESHCAHVIFLRTYKVTTYSPVLSCLIQVFAKKKKSYVSRKEDQCWAGLVLLRCSGACVKQNTAHSACPLVTSPTSWLAAVACIIDS